MRLARRFARRTSSVPSSIGPTGAIVPHSWELRIPTQKLKLTLKMDGLSINTKIPHSIFSAWPMNGVEKTSLLLSDLDWHLLAMPLPCCEGCRRPGTSFPEMRKVRRLDTDPMYGEKEELYENACERKINR